MTWKLFNRLYKDVPKPPHMLCHGIVRSSTTWQSGNRPATSSIPGLATVCTNEHAESIRGLAWHAILRLLGDGGENVLIDLLLNCGLFVPCDAAQGVYYQLSGALSQCSIVRMQADLQRSNFDRHDTAGRSPWCANSHEERARNVEEAVPDPHRAQPDSVR